MTGRARVAVVCVICLLAGGREPWLRALIYDRLCWPLTSNTKTQLHAHPEEKRVCLCRVLRGRQKQKENPIYALVYNNRQTKMVLYTTTLENVICMSKFFGVLWLRHFRISSLSAQWMTGNFNSFAAIFWFNKFFWCLVNWFLKKLPSFSFRTL